MVQKVDVIESFSTVSGESDTFFLTAKYVDPFFMPFLRFTREVDVMKA